MFNGQFRHATTDQDLIDIIKHGIAGTPMPPFNFQDAQAEQIVAYLRSQPATMAASKLAGLHGDPANGKVIFEGQGQFEGGGDCLSCHRVQTPSGKIGGFLGPDLSSIGAIRRSIDLEHALTEPSTAIRTDERVVVVTKDGKTLRGRLLNQDTYSVQLIDNQGNLQSVEKSSILHVDILTVSVMPNFADKFTPQQLADLVSYLGTLKAPIPGGGCWRCWERKIMTMRFLRVIPAALLLLCAVAASSSAQVTFDRLLHADQEPQNWLTYSGSLTGQRYSTLAKITPQNVGKLELAWVLQSHPLPKQMRSMKPRRWW